MMRLVPVRHSSMTRNLLSEHRFSLPTNLPSFPRIVQEGCANGTVGRLITPHPQDKLKHILENDRCLFNGITITDVSLPSTATLQQLTEYEANEHRSNAEDLQIRINRGRFRMLSSSNVPADKFLVYTPNTLPYNPTAPFRNALPYMPLQFSATGVAIDPVIPKELVNPGVERFVSTINETLTPGLLEEQRLIREQLHLDHIQSELQHLGSVVEDDTIALAPDAEQMIREFSEESGIAVPEGLPPCSLKEIYQLPHKKNEEKEGKKSEKGGSTSLDISKLLKVESTKGMSDVSVTERGEE